MSRGLKLDFINLDVGVFLNPICNQMPMAKIRWLLVAKHDGIIPKFLQHIV
jgi:hypothetical protein